MEKFNTILDEWEIAKKIVLIRNNVFLTLKQDNFIFQDIYGNTIENIWKLGGWWTKEVYKVNYNWIIYAMAIPWYLDLPNTIWKKWHLALKEVDNTNILKDLWYYVNDQMFVENILINKVIFPVILMKPYSDYDFLIFDGKKWSYICNPLFLYNQEINDKYMLDVCSNILDEITQLIKDNISLWYDNFNLCIDNNSMHLFFNDLWNLSIEEINNKSRHKYITFYLNCVIGIIQNSLSEEIYIKIPYLHYLEKNKELLSKMEKIIIQKL